jgi:hypothetical protein
VVNTEAKAENTNNEAERQKHFAVNRAAQKTYG